MTRVLTDRLPDSLRDLLNGEDLSAKEGETLIFITVNEDGWPHLSLLSVGEVIATSPQEIRIALWPRTTTTENLRRSRCATLAAIWQGTAYYIELEAEPFTSSSPVEDSLARFSARVRRVLADRVDYADLTTGVRFALKDKTRSVRSWQEVIQTLRA